MSLKDLQEKPKAKRVLKGVHFDFAGAEITYTDWSQGGACSLENDMVLAKAKDSKKKLTEEQEAILGQIDEEYVALEKSKVAEQTKPTSVTGEENLKGTDNMSDEILKELQDEVKLLRKERAVSKAKDALSGYEFTDELSATLSETFSVLGEEVQAVIVKSFDELTAKSAAKVEEAVAAKETELNKSRETDGTPLQKALDEEKGEGGESEQENVEKSLVQKIMDQQDKKGAK